LDLVVIPVKPLRNLAQAVSAEWRFSQPAVLSAVQDLGAVLAGGYQILKGMAEFGELYALVAKDSSKWRLDDNALRQLADAFVCDYVSTYRKIQRGELIAAQRWLHQQLAETNFRLAHELRLRLGHPSFPDARRIERLADSTLVDLRVSARTDETELRSAVEMIAAVHRRLMTALLADRWCWPDLTDLRLRVE
jgi:hypothetical protein